MEPYLIQVRLATLQNGWNWNEAAVHLTLALEWEVLQVLADWPLNKHQDIEQLIAALQQSFGSPESEQTAKAWLHEITVRPGGACKISAELFTVSLTMLCTSSTEEAATGHFFSKPFYRSGYSSMFD